MSSDHRLRPPWLAQNLLSLVLPGGGIRESVLGDLEELYGERFTGGSSRARAWYWGQAIRLAAAYGGKRVRGQRFHGFAPAPRLRETRGDGPMGILRQFKISIRTLSRSPGFAIPALLILAVGMTAATTIFAIADSVILRPLDLPDSGRLVVVCEDHVQTAGYCIVSPGNVEDLRRGSSGLSELGFGRAWSLSLSDEDGSTRVRGGLATAGFFRALAPTPTLGRLFTDEEIGPGRDRVVVLSHALWTTRYGQDRDLVGSAVLVEGEPHMVVGVLPAGFDLPLGLGGISVWKPPHFDPLDPEVRGWRGFRAIGRLADEMSVAGVEAELTGLYAGLARTHDEVDEEWRLRVDPLLRAVVGDARTVLLAFLAGAGLLLLIVCANVANLLLARGLRRKRELAVRAALGADRRRLVMQILGESLVLGLLATILAGVLASGAVRALVALSPPGIPRFDEVSMDLRVIAIAAAAAIVITLAFAILPALRVTSWSLGQAVRGGGREGEDRKSARLRGGLVIAELALSVILVASAGLLTRSFVEFLKWEPGFERDHLIAFSVFVDTGKHPTRGEFMAVIRQGEEFVASLPGVEFAASASAGPLFGGADGATPYYPEGSDPDGQLQPAWWFDTGPGYFRTLGLPLVRGREFTEADGPDSPPVAIINETLARVAWPNDDAIGRVLHFPEMGYALEVVGIVSDVVPFTPGAAPRPEVYWANRQFGRPAPFVLARTTGDPTAMAPAITEALLRADPDNSVGTPRPLAAVERRALVQPRFQALILVVLAVVALVLSAAGVYAVVSYAVARRTREIGIRMALGAQARDVVVMVVRTNLGVASVGIALGLLGSLWIGGLLEAMVHGVSPRDPVVLTGAGMVLLLGAVLAAIVPAVRATRGDPLASIRAD